MNYSVLILRRAQKELSELPTENFRRVRDTIRNLSRNPRPRGSLKLINREGWRVRVGVYRIIYDIDDQNQVVTVLHIGHRRDVY
jgi:mRNA interferase RelE/StbE